MSQKLGLIRQLRRAFAVPNLRGITNLLIGFHLCPDRNGWDVLVPQVTENVLGMTLPSECVSLNPPVFEDI